MDDLDFTIEESADHDAEVVCDKCAADAKIVGWSFADESKPKVDEYWLLCKNCGYRSQAPSSNPSDSN